MASEDERQEEEDHFKDIPKEEETETSEVNTTSAQEKLDKFKKVVK